MGSSCYMGIPRENIPWFPVIGEDKCTNCGSCLDFCSNNVFEAGGSATRVINPNNCVVGCSACQKVCSSDAIIFPSHNDLIGWIHDFKR